MKRLSAILLILVFLCGCAQSTNLHNEEILYQSRFKEENIITVSDEKVEMNGQAVGENGDVFVSHDIIYYEDRDSYESGHAYGEGGADDRHSSNEAEKHTVLNITKSGAYRVSGKLSMGQIRIDLGEDAKSNPDAVVELILDDADITCTVAPAILFMNVYECDQNRTTENATSNVDTSNAGAVLVIAEDSENNINGSYVAKIFKDGGEEKKLWKQDGAIYSYMSMNVFGNGTLNLTAENEGMDTELHLTINSGNINIYSQNDGINTNEDNVSVTTINGGNINIVAGLGDEGDGIDSNGWLVINGGSVIASANPKADAGLDSDLGSYINGGTVVALGSTMDWPESDSNQVTINLQFANTQGNGSAIVVRDKDDRIVFAYKPAESENDLERGFRGAVISSPEFKVNGEYSVYMGGTIIGQESDGIYLLDSITEYKDGEKQGYYGTDLRGGRGMDRGMKPGTPPEMPDGEPPQMPEGGMGQRPEGEPPEMPEKGKMPEGERPPIPERGEMPEGGRPHMPDDENFGSMEQKVEFIMADKVNLFTGVAKIK